MAVFTEPEKFSVLPGSAADTGKIQSEGSTLNPSLVNLFPTVYQLALAAGGKAPERTTFNEFLRLILQRLYYIERGGVWSYDATADYPAGAVVGYSGSLYLALKDSGEGTDAGAVQPDADSAVWQKLETAADLAKALLGYLPVAAAEADYLKKSDASDTYLSKTDASDTYLSKDAASDYLKKSDASDTYLSKTDASDTYLSKDAASDYLKKSDASDTYLSKTDASDTYLSKDAASDYLKKSDASDTYLSKSGAESDYLKKSDASDTYLSKSGASGTYLSKSDASDTYLSKSDASDTYLSKEDLSSQIITSVRSNWYAAYPDGAEAHNAMWGGRDITAAFDAGTVSEHIADGTFKDIFPGDYITKSVTISGKTYDVTWVVADCDYWWHKGDQNNGMETHHVAIVPQAPIFNAWIDSVNTTKYGYAYSAMYKNVIPACATGIVNAFGASHILTFRDGITNDVDTSHVSSGLPQHVGTPNWWGAWVSVQCNLMSEKMVYGAPICAAGAMDNSMATRQMSAFRLSERLINYNRQHWWLRDVASSEFFALVNGNGYADAYGASGALGVRPFALLH